MSETMMSDREREILAAREGDRKRLLRLSDLEQRLSVSVKGLCTAITTLRPDLRVVKADAIEHLTAQLKQDDETISALVAALERARTQKREQDV